MPAVLGMAGFEARNTTRDRFVVTTGSFTYSTLVLPIASPSSTSIQTTNGLGRCPWINDVVGTPSEPSGGEIWFHGNVRASALSTSFLFGTGRNGVEYITVSMDAIGKVTVRLAAAVVGTAASDSFSIVAFKRLHVHLTGDTAGSHLLVYTDGNLSTAVIDVTLSGGNASSLAAIGKPNEFYFHGASSSSTSNFDDCVAWDPTDAGFPGIQFFASCGIKGQVFNANGPETGWSGSFADIDELPCSDTDKITASAVGNESSFLKAAVAEPNVFAVKFMARVTRTGSTAGVNISLKQNDGVSSTLVTAPAPGDGDVQTIFQTAPDGGAWSPVKYDATRFAFVAVT